MLDNIEVKKLILKFPKLSNHLIEKDILLSEILEYIVILFDAQKWSNNYYLCGGSI